MRVSGTSVRQRAFEGAGLGPFIGATRPQKILENGRRAPKVAKSGEQFGRFCGVGDCRGKIAPSLTVQR